MGIKRNIVANFIGQGYCAALGLAVLPCYLKLLGAEAYGLVGFFAALQTWLQLLDLGISPAFAREVASTRGSSQEFARLRRLLHSLELLFLFLALLIGIALAAASGWIALSWFKVQSLPITEVSRCLALMGAMVGLRCFATLYAAGIKGLECQVWLNAAVVAVATLRFGGALALLRFVSNSPVHFFEYQLAVALLELALMAVRLYSALPGGRVGFRFSWEPVRGMLPVAGGIALSAFIWILVTQLDKLLLSHLLPLKEYGYLAVATVVANGVLQVASPVSQALLPKMTYLLAQGREQEMLALYRKATRLVAVIVFPLAGTLALYSSELLLAWTGDQAAARWAGPVLTWYVLGNGLLAAGAFQYYLQYAHGRLRLHVAFNAVFGAVAVPVLVFAVYRYSALGAAVSWFALNLVAFLVWPPVVHHRFAPGLHRPWLLSDLAPQLATTSLLLGATSQLKIPFNTLNRVEAVGALAAIGLLILGMNALASQAPPAKLVPGLSSIWK